MDDSQIIALFFARSENAIAELSEKYEKSMLTISRNILQNAEDAEECVNDAYLALWNAIPPNRPNPLMAYVCKIVRNLSLTRFKHNRAAKRSAGSDASLDEIADFIPANETVESRMERAELTRILNDWLGTLDRMNLYVFMRRYWYMDPVGTIAKNTGLTEAAVYLRIDRMKKNLYKRLVKEGVFE